MPEEQARTVASAEEHGLVKRLRSSLHLPLFERASYTTNCSVEFGIGVLGVCSGLIRPHYGPETDLQVRAPAPGQTTWEPLYNTTPD
jgi:hypothetical protein